MKNSSSARFARVFQLCKFRRRSYSFHNVKWPVLKLWGQRKRSTTYFRFFLLISKFLIPVLTLDTQSMFFRNNDLKWQKNDCRNAKLHFEIVFSLSSTLSFHMLLNDSLQQNWRSMVKRTRLQEMAGAFHVCFWAAYYVSWIPKFSAQFRLVKLLKIFNKCRKVFPRLWR